MLPATAGGPARFGFFSQLSTFNSQLDCELAFGPALHVKLPSTSVLGGLLLAVGFSGCSIWLEPGAPGATPPPIDFADPVLNQRQIFVTGDITPESAERIIRQLLYLDQESSSPIELNLMTPGGDLNAALALDRVMGSLRSPVNTRALGECSSGGALLLAAGTGTREAYPDSVIVLHGMEVSGKPPARYTELTQDAYTAFWQQHAQLPPAWLPLPPGKLFVLSAPEALQYRVIDRVIPNSPTNQPPG